MVFGHTDADKNFNASEDVSVDGNPMQFKVLSNASDTCLDGVCEGDCHFPQADICQQVTKSVHSC